MAAMMEPFGLVLVGYYYSGKSTCAREIASWAGLRRFDLDDMYKDENHESVLLTRSRNKKDADAKRDAIGHEIMGKFFEAPSIAIFGGGSYLIDNRDRLSTLRERSLIVYIKPTIAASTKRALKAKGEPEFSVVFRDRDDEPGIARHFEEKLIERGPWYLEMVQEREESKNQNEHEKHYDHAIIEPEADWTEDRVVKQVALKYLFHQAQRYRERKARSS